MASPDFVIAGAGIIGLSLALELDRRGASVVVLEAGAAMRQTSFAAAGMLAVDDPLNPPALRPLAQLSATLYPEFLDRIATLSGTRVPFQTTTTLEAVSGDAESLLSSEVDPRELLPEIEVGDRTFHLLSEHSVDPRQLGAALLWAARNTRIDLRENTRLERLVTSDSSVRIQTSETSVEASTLIDCMGSWSPAPVAPRKGQMLAVRMPAGHTTDLDLSVVVRTSEIYLVPRTDGPHAGRIILGATIEDAGFDLTVHPTDILGLNARAIALLPPLAQAEFVESWAGLRPSTADGLPFLGPVPRRPRYILATGHYRNGILLAPATAHVIAQLLSGETLSVDLAPYSPARL